MKILINTEEYAVFNNSGGWKKLSVQKVCDSLSFSSSAVIIVLKTQHAGMKPL